MRIHLNDGFTWDATLTKPDIWLRYRPALADQASEYYLARRTAPAEATLAMLRKHVLAWDVKDSTGKVAPLKKKTLRLLPHPIIESMLEKVLAYTADEQLADIQNLRDGTRLVLWHPVWGNLSCTDCMKYRPDEDGVLLRKPHRRGPLQERFAGEQTPCYSCPKIAEEDRARPGLSVDELRTYAVELSDRNRAALQFHLTCSYMGHFPEDAIVRRTAGAVGPILERHKQSKLDRVFFLLGGKL